MVDSPVHTITFRNTPFYIKRDDLLGPPINGNKARKFFSLFKHPPEQDTIISHGGYQSNAMLALAKLSVYFQKKFLYCTAPLPERIQHAPEGNLFQALELGMELIEIPSSESPSSIHEQFSKKGFFIRQGGAETFAQTGMKQLANEINHFRLQIDSKKMNIFIASGTGTSAFYLARHLDADVTVYTTPCVGNSTYLQQQMSHLGMIPHHLKIISTRQRYHFARPHPDLLAIYHETKSQGISFDLLYDCVMWQAIADHYQTFSSSPHLFIHTGGIEGNLTMLARYDYKKTPPHSPY